MELALLGFDLILTQSFLTVPTFFLFRMRIFILRHCIMGVDNFFFFYRDSELSILEKTLTFEQCWNY